MKKFMLGAAILVVYGLYSLFIRHHDPVLSKPSSLASSDSSKSTSDTSGSNTGGSLANNTPASNLPANSNTSYKDGSFTGSIADAYYGNLQVAVTISGGKITDVKFLQYPDTHATSVDINQQAMPYLKQEAMQTQSANVQIVSGATFTSQAFQQSLQSALSQA